MKQLDCPRCLEPFERGERFCKQCGLRKSRPFSRGRWWLFALLANLVLVVFLVVFRETMLGSENQLLNATDGATWLMFGVFGLALLLPTICFGQVYRALWLCRYGALTSGKVVEHRLLAAPKGRTRQVALVQFTPDLAQPGSYEVQHWAWLDVLPLQQQVQVRYDPYNPGGCAQVGLGIGDMVFYGLLSLMLLGVAALLAGAVLVAAPF